MPTTDHGTPNTVTGSSPTLSEANPVTAAKKPNASQQAPAIMAAMRPMVRRRDGDEASVLGVDMVIILAPEA